MKLQHKILFIFFLVFVCAFGVHEYMEFQNIKKEILESAGQKARIVRGILMSTRRVYHRQFLDSGVPLNEKTLGFLPAYALSRISKDFKSWSDYQLTFNNVSDRPRNPNNTSDPIEMKAIEFFRQNPDADERLVPYKSPEGDDYYHFSTPIRTEQYCLKCHGRREDAPPTIRDTYTTAFDYKVGDLRGIMSIKLSVPNVKILAWEHLRVVFLVELATLVFLFFVLNWLLRRYFTDPLSELDMGLRNVAAGDYSQPLEGVSGELKSIAGSFEQMAKKLSQREEVLKGLTYVDELTGIANRRSYNKAIKNEWSRAKRGETHLSVIMVDIDFFKSFNDTLGHAAGDACLHSIAQALKSMIVRAGDLTARYGGEEFVVILPGTDLNAASYFAEIMRKKVESLEIKHPCSKVSGNVTISLGVASIIPDNEEDYKELVFAADSELYRAKEAGRNCVKVSHRA